MIIVTGACGFIGSNIIKFLNEEGVDEIIAVDNLENGKKFRNIADLDIVDYLDKDALLVELSKENFCKRIDSIIHMGACSKTTEWNGKYMMSNNYEYSKELVKVATKLDIQFIYASSASVYGNGKKGFIEKKECEGAINVYAYSKLLFDDYIRRNYSETNSKIVGLRFFNVYGPNESHKSGMASVIYHFHKQLSETNILKLFEGSDGYKDGDQKRDFIHVKDCSKVVKWFLDNSDKSGVFNVGTGQANSFNLVAKLIIDYQVPKFSNYLDHLEYIPFPNELVNSYQSFTQADLNKLRKIGYENKFIDIKEGIESYLKYLSNSNH